MIQIRDIQAINTTQADAAFGLVAAADINHRCLHGGESMSPGCSGKRRRMSKRPYSRPTVPVRPVVGRCGHGGTPAGTTVRPLWRTGRAGSSAATLWARLVLQRALSS